MKLRKIIYIFLALALFNILFLSIDTYAATVVPYDGTNIDESKYPGYKALLDEAKKKYNVQLYYTGVDWNEALTIQYQGHGANPKNLFYVSDTRKGLWYCPICEEKLYDSAIPCASIDAIAYMLDPRNSLAEDSIFQFLNIIDTTDSITVEQVSKFVVNTFLDTDECKNAIVKAANDYDLNAAFLVAKMIIEQGDDGSSMTRGQGDLSGNYKGFYNFFNYNATGSGSANIITNALSTAEKEGWNSPAASIYGGAGKLKTSYIDIYGQNTFYFIKYNFSGKNTYGSHQYEQNIMGAESKGRMLRDYYGKMPEAKIPDMIIPLYENMPTKISERPDTTKRSSITYENGVITNVTTDIQIRSKPSTSGKVLLSLHGNDKVKILKRAENVSSDGRYWDIVISEGLATYGYISRIVGGDMCVTGTGEFKTVYGRNDLTIPAVKPQAPTAGEQLIATPDGVFRMTPNITVENIVYAYPTAIVTATNGERMTGGIVGTNTKVMIDGKEYRVAKRGDIDGDGRASILDVVRLLNHVKQTSILSGMNAQAGRITNGAKITILDVVSLLNYVKKTGTITL